MTRLIIKKETLISSVFMLCFFVSFFDAHLESIIGIKGLPIPEVLVLFCTFLYVLKNMFYSPKINSFNILILLLLGLGLLSGLVNNNIGFFGAIAGTIWLYKPLIAFYLGWNLKVNNALINRVLKYLFYVSIVSAIFTWTQYIYGPLNPFNFNLESSGIIGFMDNPNKNGFILLFGFLYCSLNNIKNKTIFQIIFIISILFAQSRQILIVFILIIIYYFLFIKRKVNVLFYLLVGSVAVLLFFKDTFLIRFREIDRIIETTNYFRIKAIVIGWDVLLNNFYLGSGPGTFGGIIAHLTDSPIHEKYNLFAHWENYRNLNKVPKTIDMYWPHLIVEVGILSLILNIVFYKKLIRRIKRIASKNSNLIYLLFIISVFTGLFSMSFEAAYISIPLFLLIGSELNLSKKIYASA